MKRFASKMKISRLGEVAEDADLDQGDCWADRKTVTTLRLSEGEVLRIIRDYLGYERARPFDGYDEGRFDHDDEGVIFEKTKISKLEDEDNYWAEKKTTESLFLSGGESLRIVRLYLMNNWASFEGYDGGRFVDVGEGVIFEKTIEEDLHVVE